jgi:hypothetical protein
MDKVTPIWVTEEEGRTGVKIVGIDTDNLFIFKDDLIE